MKLLSTFSINIWIFGITLCGYGLISFLVPDVDSSQAVTIPYRLSVLILNILLLLFNLNIIYPHVSSQFKNNNTVTDLLKRSSILILLLFVTFYSFRLVYDVYVRTDMPLYQDRFQYVLLWFSFTLIPSLNFLFLSYSNPNKYLLITWLFHFLMGMMAISISINPSQSNTFFTDKGRLAGAALNPIAIGQYGASLFLLSLLILLRRKSLGNRFQRRIWTIIYSIGTLIGMIVTLLAASRGPIVGWAITSLLIIFSFRRIGMRWIFTLIFIAISLVNAASFAVYQGSSVMDRILLIDDEFDPTSQGRRFLIDATVKVISDNFIFGVGIEAPGLGYPHNLVLESFLPFGLIGGIGFICIFIQAWVKSIVLLLDKNQEWDWLGVLFIQYSIISFSSGSLYASYTFWYLLFAVLGIDTQFHLDEELLRRKLD